MKFLIVLAQLEAAIVCD